MPQRRVRIDGRRGEGFNPAELGRQVADSQAVRSPLMQATLHLVTARDA